MKYKEDKENYNASPEDENFNYVELNYIFAFDNNGNNKLIELFEELNLNNNKNTGNNTNSINEKDHN